VVRDDAPGGLAPFFASATASAEQAPLAIEPTLRSRLRFGAMAAVGALLTMPLSLGVTLHSLLRPGPRTFQRWYRPWSRGILGAGGLRVRTTAHAPIDPTTPAVFVANHQVAVDIPVAMQAIPIPFGFVAKASVRKIPFLGFAVAHTACLFVDRSQPRQALASLQDAAAQVRAGHAVLFFIEGTRSYAPVLMDVRRGAFLLAVEAQVPLIPVTIRNTYRLADERALAARAGTVDVVLGAPIPTAGRTRRDIPALIETVRTAIAADLAVEHDRWSGPQTA
jgi:1-acyl-sn-glycerol-3-phosphate acyltransferase